MSAEQWMTSKCSSAKQKQCMRQWSSAMMSKRLSTMGDGVSVLE
jgi:hypothetical protein